MAANRVRVTVDGVKQQVNYSIDNRSCYAELRSNTYRSPVGMQWRKVWWVYFSDEDDARHIMTKPEFRKKATKIVFAQPKAEKALANFSALARKSVHRATPKESQG